MEPPRSISADDRASGPAHRFGAGHGPQPPASGVGEPARPGTASHLLAPGLDR
ncbi:hypothetical protein [Streptomyces sp. C184]|uniref:hypothetical protein n=1 Tax=Streptomyces sp. C184 TaxID=3237121 RepID=UPI0034C635BF